MDIITPKETEEKIIDNGIRKATLDDLPEMERINIECRKHNYKGIIAQDYLDSIASGAKLEKRKERFLLGHESYYVRIIDGKIVGFISGGKNEYKDVPYDNEINGLYVDVHHQGKNIGKDLFERLLEDEKFKDCTSLYLWTLKDNPQSRHFYEKMWGKIFGEYTHNRWYALVGYYRQK